MHHPSVYGLIADWVIFCTNKSRERFQRMRTPALTLSESRRETSRLEAELKAYGMAHSLGGNEPVSPVWIALVTTPGAESDAHNPRRPGFLHNFHKIFRLCSVYLREEG